jgi:tRNA 2-thiouridine synthesizing protein A
MELLDCRGMRCPLPIIKSAELISDKPKGFTFTLLSDDPATAPDLSAWARMTGHSSRQISAVEFEIIKS